MVHLPLLAEPWASFFIIRWFPQMHKKWHGLSYTVAYLSKEPSIESWRQVFSLRRWKDGCRTGTNLFIFVEFLKNERGGVLRIMEIQQNQGKSIKCIGKWTLARLGPVQNALKFVGILRICTKTTQKTKNIRKSASGKFQNPKNPLKSNGFSNSISVIFP